MANEMEPEETNNPHVNERLSALLDQHSKSLKNLKCPKCESDGAMSQDLYSLFPIDPRTGATLMPPNPPAVLAYTCKDCGFVELFDMQTIANNLGFTNSIENPNT